MMDVDKIVVYIGGTGRPGVFVRWNRKWWTNFTEFNPAERIDFEDITDPREANLFMLRSLRTVPIFYVRLSLIANVAYQSDTPLDPGRALYPIYWKL